MSHTGVRDSQRAGVLQEADEHGGGRGGHYVHHDVTDEEANEEACWCGPWLDWVSGWIYFRRRYLLTRQIYTL